MKHISKTMIIGFIAVAVIVSGCGKTKEIKVSEDVKKDAMIKAEDNKLRNEPVLKEKLNGLDNQDILFWIDDENLLTAERTGEKIILYSYNLESEQSTEILNEKNITRIYGKEKDGIILLGNTKQAFIYDVRERKLEEVLDLDKEFKDGFPWIKDGKEKMDLRLIRVQLIKDGYISYISNIKLKDTAEDTAKYTILNYKDNKKNTIEAGYSMAGINCKFDLTGKNVYIGGEFPELTKLNLETGEKSSMELSMPIIKNVFEDGTLLVDCTEENRKKYDKDRIYYDKDRIYRVDFDNNKITRYNENYEGKNLVIQSIDYKNEFVCYTYLGDGEDINQNIAMYGKLDGNKFVVTDKLFKNNEEKGCNTTRDFIFSPDHNKFITDVTIQKVDDNTNKSTAKKDEYLFELK